MEECVKARAKDYPAIEDLLAVSEIRIASGERGVRSFPGPSLKLALSLRDAGSAGADARKDLSPTLLPTAASLCLKYGSWKSREHKGGSKYRYDQVYVKADQSAAVGSISTFLDQVF